MTRWEYTLDNVKNTGSETYRHWNDMGRDGWELCGMYEGDGRQTVAVFRRRLDNIDELAVAIAKELRAKNLCGY